MVDIPINATEAFTVVDVTVNGQTVFAYDFLIFTADQMSAAYTSPAGVVTPLTLGVNFTVSGMNNPGGGDITLAGFPTLVGGKVTMLRQTPIVRPADYQQAGDFFAVTINRELDIGRMIDQELARDLARSHKAPAGQDGGTFSAADIGNAQANAAAAQAAADRAEAAAILLADIVVDIREFGARRGEDCTAALQAALIAGAARGQMVYTPSGEWLASGTCTYPLDCPGMVGEGDSSHWKLTANLPLISLVTNINIYGKIFSNFKVSGVFAGGAARDDSRFLKITGSGSFGFGRFRNLYFEALYAGVEFNTDPIVTSYGLESQSGWNKFENCTFWYGSRTMVYGVLFKRGSSTGNSFPKCQASCEGSALRYEGAGCVVGDIIYDGDHLGTGYIASFGPGIVYNRSMSFEGQVDAGSAGVLKFDAGQTVQPNNIKARGTFGGSQQWANVPPLRNSHIDDLGHSRWAAGGHIYNTATAGAQVLSLWDIELAQLSGCEITVLVDGVLGGVEAGYVKRVFKVTRLGGDVRVIPLAETQMADASGAVPVGWPTLSFAVNGAHIVIKVTFTPNGQVSNLNTNIVVEGGSHRVQRVAGTVEL